MKYTVVWAPEAEEELAAVWARVSCRGEIAEAANFLDAQLSRNPFTVGESRPYAQRIAYRLPLGIRFRIHEDDRLVRVVAVWLCRPSIK